MCGSVGRYHTQQAHSRCKTKAVKGLLQPFNTLPAYNESNVGLMRKHVQEVYAAKFIPGMSDFDMSVLLNNKFEHNRPPKQDVARFTALKEHARDDVASTAT